MREIKLTRGKIALVDDDDFERINNHKWYWLSIGYAARSKKINGKKNNDLYAPRNFKCSF